MVAEGNVGLAFGLVVGAGLATTIGAILSLFAKLENTKILGLGLGLSAGVMIYVSFVEIFSAKSVDAFVDAGQDDDRAYQYATLCFFAGMALTYLLDRVVHLLTHMLPEGQLDDKGNVLKADAHRDGATDNKALPEKDPEGGNPDGESSGSDGDRDICPSNADANAVVEAALDGDTHQFGLKRMGLMTALAIGIHNFPEGLATFLATLADPVSGVAIAAAIAMHNIPEGVCVAMPIYYSTGSRWKGFLWATVSGVTEILGGLLGYVILYGDNMSDWAYAIMFGIVAGMMVYISIKELLPTAMKFDPEDTFVTRGIFLGMFVMALSLVLFTF